jgi:5-methylcytosine-specific restriction protein B
LEAYKKAEDKKNAPKYIFIIDEINRGEISKIFGELFFSIDPGYRGTDGVVTTQYSNLWKETDYYDGGKKFYVPENVYIIGTMNDIDRSVESMDFAFRRRFAFKEVTAKESQQMLKSDSALSEKVDEIIGRMDALNEAICPKDNNNSDKKGIEGLSSAYHIGASYFLKLANYKKDDGTFDYDKLWDYHLKGLLSEYLRGMPDAEDKLKSLGEAFGIKTLDSNPS